MSFRPVELSDRTAYDRFFQASGTAASDYGFVNVWGWAEEYDLEIRFEPDCVLIRQKDEKPVYWAPLGNWKEMDWNDVFTRLRAEDELVFTRVPESLLTVWQSIPNLRLEEAEERGHWDYIYRVEDLIALKGNKLHKKKNLATQFVKQYPYQYAALDASGIRMAMEMQAEWCDWKDCESSEELMAENNVIKKIFSCFTELKDELIAGAVFVEGKMAGYTIAQKYGYETVLIHFEKGDTSYKGIYQALNKLFLEHQAAGYRLVNRESDLDNPGLRKAKLSYRPVDFVKKYSVTVF